MAANSGAIRGVASFPKRFVKHVRTRDPVSPLSPPLPGFSCSSRNVHASVYDKNVDEHVCPAVVPDDIVQQKSEYWAPNPHTGVFGPAAEAIPRSETASAGGGSESVLEQKAFFRGMENLDKPQHP